MQIFIILASMIIGALLSAPIMGIINLLRGLVL
jgi:hypothetical protein